MEKVNISKSMDMMIQQSMYKGKRYVDMRMFVSNEATNYNGPTKTGITFPATKLDEVIEKLQKIREEMV